MNSNDPDKEKKQELVQTAGLPVIPVEVNLDEKSEESPKRMRILSMTVGEYREKYRVKPHKYC